MEVEIFKPELLGSTETAFSCSIDDYRLREARLQSKQLVDDGSSSQRSGSTDGEETNYFKSIQWSPDGTCLLTSSADNNIRTFIPPPDLLARRPFPLTLTSYSSQHSPEPIYALTPYPFFNLRDPSTALLLSSPRDLPIRLSNALYPSLLTTYPLVSPTTEAYLTPASLIWTVDGTHFLTGTDSLIALFDVSRSGAGPAMRLPTIPSKRHNLKGGGVGMRGIVSCLSIQPTSGLAVTSLLAAGSWTRWVSLYDAAGLGGTVANWSIAEAADNLAQIGGAGVSQTLWSPCGRYLFVVERKSRGVLVYDVRVTGRLVGWLNHRAAETNQRLGVEVFGGTHMKDGVGGVSETEVWAGGTDGIVRVWRWKEVDGEDGVEQSLKPVREWQAHESTVTSVAVHPSGTVVATSSGHRQELCDLSDSDSEKDSASDSDGDSGSQHANPASYTATNIRQAPDNSIKIWNF